jgi:small-conductance mechanosensitive channel
MFGYKMFRISLEMRRKLGLLVKAFFFMQVVLLAFATSIVSGQTVSTEPASDELAESELNGYPVTGVLGDTIFYVFTRTGATLPKERAKLISERIRGIFESDFFAQDSIILNGDDGAYDISYKGKIIVHITEKEAKFQEKRLDDFALETRNAIAFSIAEAKETFKPQKILTRIAYGILGLFVLALLLWLVGKLFGRLLSFIEARKDKLLKNLTYKDYTFLTAEQEMRGIVILLNVLKWVVKIVIIYIALSVIFSIFPATRSWANLLLDYVRKPIISILIAVRDFLPNLFTIVIIFLVMRYFIKFVKYIFREIDSEKLKIPDFHADWAMPTYGIVRVLLYAFMVVLIFPYLPGSDSNVFRGVSVFIGLLVSFGSSSAISNMVAGLVITYMRPFKIGDRIKIGEISGTVIEKTLLVTRLQTIKNEEITIPNATLLNSNTMNFSAMAHREGLLIHTTVTIGYDVPWRIMHQTLMAAAKKTSGIKESPEPFVLQTALEDFYVAYQINAYTSEARKMVLILSELHQNIQDECNARGIEIMSPHYRAMRDGNNTTIPADYLDKDYKVPAFQVQVKKDPEP